MRDSDCIGFLKWALPQLDLRWPGFRKVRTQVCKRLRRRLRALDLTSLDQYREYLAREPSEWKALDGFCRITISRFYRDKRVFEVLGRATFPELAEAAQRERRPVRCWCAGCASGEEVYTLRMVWEFEVQAHFSDVEFMLIGTDADPVMIERARSACFSRGSLADLPRDWLADAFEESDDLLCVKDRYRGGIVFLGQDIRQEMPAGPFDLILCRNIVFTYFAADLQRTILDRMRVRLSPRGFLVLGAHECLPEGDAEFRQTEECREIWHRKPTGRDDIDVGPAKAQAGASAPRIQRSGASP